MASSKWWVSSTLLEGTASLYPKDSRLLLGTWKEPNKCFVQKSQLKSSYFRIVNNLGDVMVAFCFMDERTGAWRGAVCLSFLQQHITSHCN